MSDETPRESPLNKNASELVSELALLGAAISASMRELRDTPDLSPDGAKTLDLLRSGLQMFDAAVADFRGPVVAGNPQPAQTVRTDIPRASKPSAPPTPPHASSASPQRKAKSRPRNPAMDAALLHIFDYEDRTDFPIGQSTLKKVMRHFNKDAKKSTLVSKVNRWKNDHDYLRWSHSEDIHRTPAGKEKADQMMAIARRDGHEEAIVAAINKALNIRKGE